MKFCSASLMGGMAAGLCMLLSTAVVSAETKQDFKLKTEKPVLLTSAGQSADVQMIKVLMERLKIDQKFSALAGPGDLQGMGSMIIVIGGSTKGLGAAGLEVDKEAGRIQKVMGKAREHKVPMIAMHIGGKGRRGELSDKFIQIVAPAASCLIVVKEGDADEIFTKIATKQKIPLIIVNRISDVQEHLKNIYQ